VLCGATELYRATGEQHYLDDALSFDAQLGATSWETTATIVPSS
jgi:hypothetical protein